MKERGVGGSYGLFDAMENELNRLLGPGKSY